MRSKEDIMKGLKYRSDADCDKLEILLDIRDTLVSLVPIDFEKDEFKREIIKRLEIRREQEKRMDNE